MRERPVTQVMAQARDLDTQNVLVRNAQIRLSLSQRFDQLAGQMAHPENDRKLSVILIHGWIVILLDCHWVKAERETNSISSSFSCSTLITRANRICDSVVLRIVRIVIMHHLDSFA